VRRSISLVFVVWAGLAAGLRPASAADMVRIPAGSTRIGSDHGRADERPSFMADVAAFDLDRTPVTVGAFAEFVRRTRYVTDAERHGASALMTFGTGQWQLVEGASWREPLGRKGPRAESMHPVTHVSWGDADAYCAAQGKRLPGEVEWEHAARAGGAPDRAFAFGQKLVGGDGRYRANVWTGVFPVINTVADGYRTTSPVGAFGTDAAGLTDMAGNVWEWTGDWYRPYAARVDAPTAEKVQRGGSFLCDPKFCYGFRVTARGHASPESSHMHVGFRCARDVPTASVSASPPGAAATTARVAR
jgi:formylglycine-generating enzyme